ncbi:serine hydrolase domain-containing protein [Corallococcus carmarthensis]|uniref:serine hydrolase domain-containing protein n=1 Tax=Corallococcus carmarthensis TaxID=2316728 RepID=UPI00148CA73F|nr:serine hydrolase domain-containing protein [Corallococcus carmarthensis]NOK16718.1 beta-lactamase family protein [Corallococcus carmarthensis]
MPSSPALNRQFARSMALGALLAVASAHAAPAGSYPLPPVSSRHEARIEQARAFARKLLKDFQLPGLSVAVAQRGQVVWSEGFGFADLEQDIPVTPLTRFRVGSVSKVLTAAGVARLVEEGRLNLDAPIQKYVPSFPPKPWPITTRQLTGHLAGIRHYLDRDEPIFKEARHFSSVTQGLGLFQEDALLSEPGTAYAYSSYGFNLVGAVMEGAAQEEFLRYMQRAVFEPLGMRHTQADHPHQLVPHRTRFYANGPEGSHLHAAHVDNSYKWPGGGFLSTAEDLVVFGSAHLQPGFLRKETLALLFTPQKLKSGKETGVGIGWRIGVSAQGRRILHHRGAIEGGRAMLMIFPDSQLVVALLANTYADFAEEQAAQLGELFMTAPR